MPPLSVCRPQGRSSVDLVMDVRAVAANAVERLAKTSLSDEGIGDTFVQ